MKPEEAQLLSTSRQTASGDTEDYYERQYKCNENRTNLIVNYLPPSMTQDEVRALFSSIGDVESCKLVRDKLTGESLGYAFVKFVYALDADKAIKTLNGLRLQNKTIKVSLARPSSEAIKGANLYICGLPKKMTQAELEQLFRESGKIITARILYDNKTGLSRGVAFIRFDQKSEAELAIRKLNGFQPESSVEPITVKFANSPSANRQDSLSLVGGGAGSMNMAKPKPAPAISGPLPPSNTSMVSAPQSVTAGMVSPTIQQLPSLHRYNCPTIGNNGSTPDQLALSSSVPPMPIAVSNPVTSPLLTPALAASSGALTATGWCIFVYNLFNETDDATLWELFGPFGAVQTVKVIRDTTNVKCKGFGFVTMSNYEEALLAIQSLNGFILANRTLQVSFKTSPNPQLKTASSSPSASPSPSVMNQPSL